jgi:hypothetical protein
VTPIIIEGYSSYQPQEGKAGLVRRERREEKEKEKDGQEEVQEETRTRTKTRTHLKLLLGCCLLEV